VNLEAIDINRGIAMSYSEFTLRKVKQAFGLNTVEDKRLLPEINPITPSTTLGGKFTTCDCHWQRKGTFGINYQSHPG
jgi:hypothetical protein